MSIDLETLPRDGAGRVRWRHIVDTHGLGYLTEIVEAATGAKDAALIRVATAAHTREHARADRVAASGPVIQGRPIKGAAKRTQGLSIRVTDEAYNVFASDMRTGETRPDTFERWAADREAATATAPHGWVCDYATNRRIRHATADELAESIEQAERDSGSGVITVEGVDGSVYVED
jgi:hypothetical protein